jgi:hypothetical protein
MFKTPRLLLEAHNADGWKPVKIYCNFRSVRLMLNVLPRIAQVYGGLDNVRVKYLATHDQIADAKLAIYRGEHNGHG